MFKRKSRRPGPRPQFEPLECPTLLSAVVATLPTDEVPGGGTAALVSRAASSATTTTLKVSKLVAKLGDSLRFTVQVKAAKGAGPVAGTVQLINNGTTITAGLDPLGLTLSGTGGTATTFSGGNVGIYAAGQRFAALVPERNGL